MGTTLRQSCRLTLTGTVDTDSPTEPLRGRGRLRVKRVVDILPLCISDRVPSDPLSLLQTQVAVTAFLHSSRQGVLLLILNRVCLSVYSGVWHTWPHGYSY